MRVLIIGTGVIGVTYAWQLSKSGNDVSLFVRKEKKELIENQGLNINCLDLRHKSKKEISEVYKPEIVCDINEDEGYELIIVPINSNEIKSILPVLSEYKSRADILFFHNKWSDNCEIEKYLEPSRYLLGFPFKSGGGRDGNRINTVIFGDSICVTMLGECDGRITERVKKIESIMKSADMNPEVSSDIMSWLWTHYVWAAANLGAYIKAGSYEKFSKNTRIIRELYLAMKEGFEICKIRGADPRKVYPVKLFYLPLFLLIPYTKYFYNKPGMKEMFEGHVLHSPEEMKAMYYELLQAGVYYGIRMPYYEGLKKSIDDYYGNNV